MRYSFGDANYTDKPTIDKPTIEEKIDEILWDTQIKEGDIINHDEMKQKLLTLMKVYGESLLSQIEPFDLVDDCNPDCTKEEHAYHSGTWTAHLKLEKIIKELRSKNNELTGGEKE